MRSGSSPEPGRFVSGVGYLVAQSVSRRANQDRLPDISNNPPAISAANHFAARTGRLVPVSNPQPLSDLFVSLINSVQLGRNHGGEFSGSCFWKPAREPYLRGDDSNAESARDFLGRIRAVHITKDGGGIAHPLIPMG